MGKMKQSGAIEILPQVCIKTIERSHTFKTQNAPFCFLSSIPFSVYCRSVSVIANDSLIIVELDARQYSLFYHYLPLDHRLNQGLRHFMTSLSHSAKKVHS